MVREDEEDRMDTVHRPATWRRVSLRGAAAQEDSDNLWNEKQGGGGHWEKKPNMQATDSLACLAPGLGTHSPGLLLPSA